MLQVQALQYCYPGSPPLRFPAFGCAAGEALLVTGDSGCGKTTLLHLVGGLIPLQTGSIVLGGQSFAELSSRGLDRFRARHIGIIFQQAHFVSSLTVMENVLLAAAGAGRQQNRQEVAGILERLGIAPLAAKKPAALSAGQQQRVSVARALLNRPALLLADEPTASLDDRHTAEVAALLLEQANLYQAALVVVTHDHRLRRHFTHNLELS
ncbi:MAG: ATP-binding cassette domain-containing protein [Flavihumibacter sp.]